MTKKPRIAFVRRGYSRSGGAEAYLKRLADGITKAGHEIQLVATNEWPEEQWPFGSIKRLEATTVMGFADELEQVRPQLQCDVLFSLERVWSCDVYRAGDGVHRAWLARRKKFEVPLKQFVRSVSRKHRDLLQLEESLFEKRKAGRVIAASQMVVDEITNLYRYSADKIDVVRNGEEVRILAMARSFLHHQVRSMVGSLVLVGEGKWSSDDLANALDARDRTACGPVAPPDGLYLIKVEY